MVSYPACRIVGFWLLLFCACTICAAQKITINQIELNGEEVNLYYTLSDSAAGHTYHITAYTSKDNYTLPLRKVSGDAGRFVVPGEKKLVWKPLQEFGQDFDGKVSFEIRAKLYIPFITLKDFGDEKKMKRGKAYEISWAGANAETGLSIELFNGEERVLSFHNVSNLGYWSFYIPETTKPGSYHLVFSDGRKKDEFVQSPTFSIVRKVPRALKVVPAIALGAMGYLMFGGNSSGHDDSIPFFPGAPAGK